MSAATEVGAARRLSEARPARAGLVAGPLWVGVVVVITALEWDFLHRHGWTVFGHNDIPYPSYTALGSFGYLQVANFLVTGLLFMTFVQGLGRQLHGWTGVTGRVLLTLTGAAIATSAFRTDRVPGDPSSWHGWIHAISFIVILVTSTLGLVLAGLALRHVPGWRQWGTATAVLGPWQFAMLPVGGALLPGDTSFYCFILTLFGWVFLTARRLTTAG